MKRKRLTRQKRNLKSIKKNHRLILLVAFYVLGSIIGAVAIKNTDGELLSKTKELTESFITQRCSQSILQNFVYSLTTDTVFMLLAAVFGLCLIGEPIIWLLPFVRGLGVGFISGYFLRTYAVSGFMYFLVILLIPLMLSVSANIFICKEAIINSRSLFVSAGKSAAINPAEFYKLYALRMAVLYSIMVISAIVSTILTVCFAGKFNLLF